MSFLQLLQGLLLDNLALDKHHVSYTGGFALFKHFRVDFALFSTLSAEGNNQECDNRHAHSACYVDPGQVVLFFDALLDVYHFRDSLDFDDFYDFRHSWFQTRVIVCEAIAESELAWRI